MKEEEIFVVVKNEIKRYVKADTIKPQDTFTNLGGHSLDALKIISNLERRFDIKIKDQLTRNNMTFGDISQLIFNMTNGRLV